MNVIDFKIKTLCDISFFNEEGEHILSNNNEIVSSPIKLNKSLELDDEEKETLNKNGLLSFTTYFLVIIKDLETWQKEKIYLSWEEDDVNFLNFMLRSKCLYSPKIMNTYSDFLKELLNRCLTPFILSSIKDEMFYDDLSYWFKTSGKAIYKELSLNEDLELISNHFKEQMQFPEN